MQTLEEKALKALNEVIRELGGIEQTEMAAGTFLQNNNCPVINTVRKAFPKKKFLYCGWTGVFAEDEDFRVIWGPGPVRDFILKGYNAEKERTSYATA